MSESPAGTPPSRMQLIDMAAIVVGYGLAAMLIRAFWPQRTMASGVGFFAVGFYIWLGLAMSGPLILLRHRHGRATGSHPALSPSPVTSITRTWAETAWLLIGVYWIVMGVCILPIRLHRFRAHDSILFGLVPLGAGLVFRLLKPRGPAHSREVVPWTHRVAVYLLVTWPPAWICLIVMAQAML